MTRLLATITALLAISAGIAQAAPVKQYTPTHASAKCRAHYVKRHRGKHHHKVVCVYVAPKTAATKTLASHIDPTFTQDGLVAAYSFSASATQTVDGVTSPVASLPNGVLDLYSDGLLECSLNVGGAVTGGTCAVTYTAYGTHTVVVTYTSGTLSNTDTETATIVAPVAPPAPPTPQALATTSYLSVDAIGADVQFDANTFDSSIESVDGVVIVIVDATTGQQVGPSIATGCQAHVYSAAGTVYLGVPDDYQPQPCVGSNVPIGPIGHTYEAEAVFTATATDAGSVSAPQVLVVGS